MGHLRLSEHINAPIDRHHRYPCRSIQPRTCSASGWNWWVQRGTRGRRAVANGNVDTDASWSVAFVQVAAGGRTQP